VTAAVDVESGKLQVTDFDNLDSSEYATAILASASVPGVFPWTELRG
jgi:predicted acylesterase/phospholipase RssA